MDGREISFPYRKAEAIFYYLCTEKQTTRDALVSVFWGSSEEDAGRKSLRQALFQMRRLLGEEIIILLGRNGLKLNPGLRIDIDWDAPDAVFCKKKERFLDFFYLKDCAEFDIWVEKQRDDQTLRVISYIGKYLKNGSAKIGSTELKGFLDAWQFFKPWDEKMIVMGMKCCIQSEDYEYGIKLYREFAGSMQEDLGEAPSHAAELIYRTLLHRKKTATSKAADEKNRFFFRRSELVVLNEHVFCFLEGEQTSSVLIEGEAGVGKTCLLQRMREMEYDPGVLKLATNCYSAETGFPLRAFRDLLRQIEEMCVTREILLPDSVKEVLPELIAGQIAAEDVYSESALMNGVMDVFKALASEWKILLFVDSLQWMDPLSRRILQRIMIEYGNEEVFLMAACRSGEKRNVYGLVLALQERGLITPCRIFPFSEEETAYIVKNVLGDDATREEIQEIYYNTEGNPLVLMETLVMMKQVGSRKMDDMTKMALPRTDMFIQLQLEELDAEERRVLDAMSIYFDHAEPEDLEILTGMEHVKLMDIMNKLISSGLVGEAPYKGTVAYRFRHRFYRNYVHHALSLGLRQLWHRTAAEYYDRKRTENGREDLLPGIIRHYEYGDNRERAAALAQEFCTEE